MSRASSGRSTPAQCNRSLHDLSAALRVDGHALAPVARHHDEIGSEARTFDVKLQAIALRIADSCTANTARAFGPAAADLVLLVGAELAGEIEIIAVAGATELKIDFMLAAAALPVIGVATNTFGGAVIRP